MRGEPMKLQPEDSMKPTQNTIYACTLLTLLTLGAADAAEANSTASVVAAVVAKPLPRTALELVCEAF